MRGTEPSPSRPRPEVLVNCAVSLDGRLAYAGGRRARLSGPEDLARVHELRAGVDAILVGVGTVIMDDPSLRVHWELLGRPPGPNPMRVVLDSMGRTPERARVLDGSAPTLIATADGCERRFPPAVRTAAVGHTQVELDRLWVALLGLGVRRVLVEGGATVLASVLGSGAFDRLTVYVAPVLIGGHTAPPLVLGPEAEGEAETIRLRRVSVEPLGEGVLLAFRPRPPTASA
jgi:2,5-diamino-6-(ribosylamino)-4(3H)-pyrimidinone 5'-phosphate reductase